MRRPFLALGLVAGCSFSGGQTARSDGPGLDPAADAEVLVRPDADPQDPDAMPPPPDAMPAPDAMPGTPDAPPDAQLATCAGYVQVPGGFPAGATYRGHSLGAPWQTARGQCQAEGADLVVIDNAAEADGVATLIDEPDSPFYWVGVFDPSGFPDNNFTSVRGGAPPYVLWANNQPSGGFDNCVLVGDFGVPHEFYDYGCGAGQDYVCECLP